MESIRNLVLDSEADLRGQVLSPEQVDYLERRYAQLCDEIVSRPIGEIEQDSIAKLAFAKGKADMIKEMLRADEEIREIAAEKLAAEQAKQQDQSF